MEKDNFTVCEISKNINNKKRKLDDEYKNLCIECEIDIGKDNPRQLCGKTYCLNETKKILDSNVFKNI